MSDFYVYLHRFHNGSVYVGKGRANRAWSLDRKRLPKWWSTFVKYGAPTVEFVGKNLDDAESLRLEIETIRAFRNSGANMCNMTDGGEGLSGYEVSAETREKLRVANTGRVVSDETRHKIKLSKSNVSEQTRQKIRIANTGKIQSNETKLKRARSMAGHPVSAETREKLRQSNLGWSHSEESRKKMTAAKVGKIGSACPSSKIVLCSNGMTFFGTFEAQRWLRDNGFEKAHAPRVAAVCRGERHIAYGLTWSYK